MSSCTYKFWRSLSCSNPHLTTYHGGYDDNDADDDDDDDDNGQLKRGHRKELNWE